jgi:hypothetical protein
VGGKGVDSGGLGENCNTEWNATVRSLASVQTHLT